MVDLTSVSISVLSLAVSCYALYRRGPQGMQGERGEKGDIGAVGDTGPRGPQGEQAETPIPTRPVEPVRVAPAVDARPKFLTKESRREQIAAQADDPDFQDSLEKIRQRIRDDSGLIAPDPDANNSNQVDWRKRNAM